MLAGNIPIWYSILFFSKEGFSGFTEISVDDFKLQSE